MVYFWPDIVLLTRGLLGGLARGKPLDNPHARLAWLIIVGTIPIVVCGLTMHKFVEGVFRSLYVIAATAIFFALVLMAAELLALHRQKVKFHQKGLKDLGWVEGLVVGFAQVFALVPGASRSGVTITGGLFAGLARPTAAHFSFLLSLPSVFGAGLYQLHKARKELLGSQEAAVNLVLATVVSGIVGYAAIAFLMRFLRTHTTWVFIVYRLIFGAVLLGLLWKGALADPPSTESKARVILARPSR
jgi:undecaprenyl-diphosphatase